MGLILAIIGLYGLVSYSVSCRTREFGIRVAIGASSASLLRMVLHQGMLLAICGIVLGIGLSFAAATLVKSLVPAESTDPIPYVVVPFLLAVVTLLACYGPARRASRIDPMKALRYE